MKVKIDADEWYPVFHLSNFGSGIEVEVDEATHERWKKVEEDFERYQDELERAYKEASGLEVLDRKAN